MNTEAYSPTPEGWSVMPRVRVSVLAGNRTLVRGELNTPAHDVGKSEEPYESTDPTVHGR